MIAKESSDYSKVLEDMRHVYKQKYNVVMDDELLYLIIRINEMQVAVNNKIEKIPKVTFHCGRDYFIYSLGKYLAFLIFGVGLTLLASFLFILKENKVTKTYKVLKEDKGTTIRLFGYNSTGDTVLFITKQKINSSYEKSRH